MRDLPHFAVVFVDDFFPTTVNGAKLKVEIGVQNYRLLESFVHKMSLIVLIHFVRKFTIGLISLFLVYTESNVFI